MARYGEIVSFNGSWGSGIASLTIKNHETGEEETIFAESGPTGRALQACYGADEPGNIINNEVIKGKMIYYAVDELGMLEGFEPAE